MKKMIVFLSVLLLASCASYKSQTTFPNPQDVFITSGDGDITKPYTPVGQLIYMKSGFRIPLPIFGMIGFADVDPDEVLKDDVFIEVRKMGGDALINMKIDWSPANSGFLGLAAQGGSLAVYGTVIKR